MLGSSFSPLRMKALEPAIASIARDLIDDMRRVGPPGDIRESLAEPLAASAISLILGIPREDHDKVLDWSEGCLDIRNIDRATESDMQLTEYMERLLDQKLRNPSEDLLSDMSIYIRDNPHESRREIIGLAAGLRFASQLNTPAAIDRAVYLFLTHPEYLDELHSGSAALKRAVEEVLRHPHPVSPRVAGIPRYAHEDIGVDAHTIQRGDLVIFDLDEANRDSSVFDSPLEFHPDRRANQHLAFGYGGHYCVAASLARLELKVVLETIFEMLPNLRLATDIDNLSRNSERLSGGLTKLPVSWDQG
ncbi:cytochrome P450 [Nocardia sp. CA-136227]|uniref:cytochrome P450 n=1 Tax=Nocardia sp. CA-136227 TaxID=3239979 RepID=UPI003D9670AD